MREINLGGWLGRRERIGRLDQANQQVVGSNRASVISRLEDCVVHCASWPWSWDACNPAALDTVGSAVRACVRVPVGVGADAVDRESGEVGGRGHLGGVEFDHPVVQAVTDSGHGANGSVVVGTLDNDRRAGTTAVPAVNPTNSPVLSWPMVRGCNSSLDDDARPTTKHNRAVSGGDAHDGTTVNAKPPRQPRPRDVCAASRRR